ncbi:MAG TPA: carboxypeptidase regulatory-like domain-containing protein, partial [Patescibacteria group bacterium]|nr:carboxypeptidase regulatory-like domain-containing protein [Patescibacteria group bacterium]
STDDIGVNGYYVLENNIPIAQLGSTATSFDSNRSTNSVYNYQIVAFDAARNYSTLSNTKQVTTGYVGSGGDGFNDHAFPSVPANFKITKITPQQVKLTWSDSTDDRGIEGYDVFKDDRWVSIRQTGTSYVDSDLVAGSKHTYQIRAADTSLKTSAKESLSVTTDSQTANTGNLVGTLLDEHSYVGLRPVVSFTLTDGIVETAKPVRADGFYVFNNIPAGTYTVTYSLGGFVKQTRSVTITADKTTTVDMLIPKLFH